jgi:hypothetical protein
MMPSELQQARKGSDRRFLLGFGFSPGEDAKIFNQLTTTAMRKQMIGSGRSGRASFLSLFMPLLSSTFLATWLSATAAMAGGAPRQLFNKSIDVYWGENTSNKRVADGVVVNASGRIQRIIYISSAGRPFIRVSGGNSDASHTYEVGPDVAKASTDFRGNQLVLTGNNMAVAGKSPSHSMLRSRAAQQSGKKRSVPQMDWL